MKPRFRECVECGGPLPPPGRRGPPRRLCSERCKKRAQRRRFADLETFEAWRPDPDDIPDLQVDPDERRRQLVEAVLAMGGGRLPASPEDCVARGVLEIRQLIFTIRRAAVDLAPGARGPVERFVREVGASLEKIESAGRPLPPEITPA